MNSLKQAALEYAKRGWPIFPARSDKTPYTQNGVLDATTNSQQINKWWTRYPKANIALDVAGAGMMVLDLDPGHSMKELEENVGPIPDTNLRATTPRGGGHLFLSIGDGEVVAPSASKLAPFVDVRSFHSYVLLAPSSTADGEYSWERDDIPAFRTDEILRLANSGKEKSKDRDNWLIEPDLPENVSLAVDWLRKDAKIATKGQGGDHMTYATAAYMKSFGISKEMAFDLLWEHWCPRCTPPWEPENANNLEEKINNAYAYNTSQPGNVTPAFHAAKASNMFNKVVHTVDDNDGEWRAGKFRFVSREGMSKIQPPSWIIKDFIPAESYILMYGDPGTFKTFLALDIALSVAVGLGFDKTVPWPDVEETGPVLFAAGEGRSNISNRVSAWEKTHFGGKRVSRFNMVDPVPSITEDLDLFMEGAFKRSPEGYKLVVIDTVGRAMQGCNENSQEHASAFTGLVQQIQYEFGCSVLCLHHIGKQDKENARGSSVFGADADTMIKLDRMGKSYTVELSMKKQKDAEEWKGKAHVQLEEIILGEDAKSLVAVAVITKDIPEVKRQSEKELFQSQALNVLEEVALEILSGNKLKDYTNNKLAEAIACDDKVSQKSQVIAKKYLKDIREDNERRLAQCWSPSTNRWRYQD